MGLPAETNPIFLSKQEKWYADYLDNLPVGIYRSTLEGKFVFCNQAMAMIFGFASAREMMGYPVIELYVDKKDRGRLIQSVMDNGSIRDVTVLLKTKQGQPIRCAISSNPAFDDDGIMVFMDGVMREITHTLEETGTEKKHPAAEKLQGVLEMAGGVAHMMNQPLTILNHHANEILSVLHPGDGHYENMLQMHRQIRKLNDIAEKIRGIHKYEVMDYVEGIRIVDIDKAS